MPPLPLCRHMPVPEGLGESEWWEKCLGGGPPHRTVAVTPLLSPAARPGNTGTVKTLGNTYQFTVDVCDFAPEDIIVTTSNNQIEVHAEKVGAPSLPCLPPKSSTREPPNFHLTS